MVGLTKIILISFEAKLQNAVPIPYPPSGKPIKMLQFPHLFCSNWDEKPNRISPKNNLLKTNRCLSCYNLPVGPCFK